MVLLLAPFAPHLGEELWQKLGNSESVFKQPWPQPDQDFLKEDMVEIIVQINGKMRDKISVSVNANQAQIEQLAKASKIVQQWIDNKPIKKTIYVGNKLINFVI